MATDEQRAAVRYDLHTVEASMSDDEIDTLYTRASARYGSGTDATEAYVRIIALRRLLAGAAKQVDYRQNQSEEKLSQRRPAIEALLKVWRDEFNSALDGERSSVRFGGLKRYQTHLVEYPSDWTFPSIDSSDVSRLDT